MALLSAVFTLAVAAAQVPTTLDGVYSPAQAERGKKAFDVTCGACHGTSLEGVSAPSLTGEPFLDRWREYGLDVFYDFIRENMPPRRQPTVDPTEDRVYLDILTHILNRNGYRTGSAELTREALGRVIFVGKSGPQPVPDGSLIKSTGCLVQTEDLRWILRGAVEPQRTRVPDSSTSEEKAAALAAEPGPLTFRLTDLEAVPSFKPETHKGHKVQVKGYLTRQPAAERISLSLIEMVSESCSLAK